MSGGVAARANTTTGRLKENGRVNCRLPALPAAPAASNSGKYSSAASRFASRRSSGASRRCSSGLARPEPKIRSGGAAPFNNCRPGCGV